MKNQCFDNQIVWRPHFKPGNITRNPPTNILNISKKSHSTGRSNPLNRARLIFARNPLRGPPFAIILAISPQKRHPLHSSTQCTVLRIRYPREALVNEGSAGDFREPSNYSMKVHCGTAFIWTQNFMVCRCRYVCTWARIVCIVWNKNCLLSATVYFCERWLCLYINVLVQFRIFIFVFNLYFIQNKISNLSYAKKIQCPLKFWAFTKINKI